MKFIAKMLIVNLIGGLALSLATNAGVQLWDEVLKDKTHKLIVKIKSFKKEKKEES